MPLTINVNYHNFTTATQAAFARAVTTWENTLYSAVTVNVEAYWGVNLGGALTSMCIPNGIINFGKGTVNTWYPSALADKLTGLDLQLGQPDMAVFFDKNFNWFSGPGNPASTQYDLQSIALHELCHGFGFFGLFWVDITLGSYGNNNLFGVIPRGVQPLPFVLPNLNNFPSVYGRNISTKSFEYLTDPAAFTNGSVELGNTLQGNINQPLKFYSVPSTTYEVYVPNPFAPFTSIEHLDPVSFPNSLMRPSIGPGQVIRIVDAPVQLILKALGW